MFLVMSLVFVVPIDITLASGGDTTTVTQQNAMCGKNAGLTNPKSSLLLSIVTMCLPGILEKINDWNQIKCQEVQCMYNAVKNNLDPSFCSKTKAYQVCTSVIGEVFAIPPMAILEYYKKIMAQLLANPVGMAYSLSVIGARHYIKVACTNSHTCSPSLVVGSVFIVTTSDIASLIQRFKDMLENGFFPPGVKDQPDYCDGIGDIAKEMEDIIKNP